MTRQELKQQIINYLNSVGVVDVDKVKKALEVIKQSADETVSLHEIDDAKMRKYAKEAKVTGEFYYRISWAFSPKHYSVIANFVKQFEAILDKEAKAAIAIEEEIEKEIKEIIDPLDDEYYDEIGCPDFAVVVYADYIEVRAYEPGVGDRLPRKGRKYTGCPGNVRWTFPKGMLEELKAMKRPTVFAGI